MARAVLLLMVFSGLITATVMLDRIAIVVQNAIIKDSDIDRDLRVTDFLNDTPVVIDSATRKASANRLIDQTFIRDEILSGDYPRATLQDADKQIAAFEKERFHSQAAYQAALRRAGISEEDVRLHVQWQLTVLNFIDNRFKPAAYVSDEEVTAYYKEHETALKRQFQARSSLNELRAEITSRLAAEKVNQLFFAWLDGQRKNGHVDYHEVSLR
jgi:hypothetical protein